LTSFWIFFETLVQGQTQFFGFLRIAGQHSIDLTCWKEREPFNTAKNPEMIDYKE
jgi:hypothetical protein